MDLGVDGWWPDQGDGLDGRSRLARIRMYWEGPQLYRPNERPFALHRNGYAGMQRYGAFLWSGDVFSTWETLKTHVPVAVNTGLSGIPVLGHRHRRLRPDARIHRRAARPLVPVRHVLSVCSARTAGPGTCACPGDGTPARSVPRSFATTPAARGIRIRASCEMRRSSRSSGSTSSCAIGCCPTPTRVAKECCDTGLPMMRSLWLHYPHDAAAVARGDQFLWGRDLLVSPVVEKGATSAAPVSAEGLVVRLLDGGADRGRPRDRARRRSRDDAAARSRRRDHPARAGSPVRRTADRRADDASSSIRARMAPSRSTKTMAGHSTTARAAFMRIAMAWDDAARRLSMRPGAGVAHAAADDPADAGAHGGIEGRKERHVRRPAAGGDAVAECLSPRQDLSGLPLT